MRGLLLTVIGWGLFVVGARAETMALRHVDATRGDDAATGAADAPWASVARARDGVRALIADGMTGDVVVEIAAGDYYLDAPLTFTTADSGRDGFRVIYRGAGADRVRVVGGRPVTGWEPYRDGIYRSRLQQSRPFHVLYQNGAWAQAARSPNQGYFRAAGGSDDASRTALQFHPEDLPEPFDCRDAQVLVWAGTHSFTGADSNYDWYTTLSPITGIDWKRHRIELGTGTWWAIAPHNRYYVRHALALLDAPGEWYLDHAAMTLYYRPREASPAGQEIIAPTTVRLLSVAGDSMAAPVAHLTFEGMTLTCGDGAPAVAPGTDQQADGLVFIEQARDIRLHNCVLRNGGLNGVGMGGYCQEVDISGCLIEDCGYHAITAGGYEIGTGPFDNAEQAYVNRRHRIHGNHLRRCGRLLGHGSGVSLYQSGDNEISHNLIEEMPRYGINMIGWTYVYMVNPVEHGGLGGRIYGRQVTRENAPDFVYTRNNRVVANEFRRVMLQGQDGGAITGWGMGRGNVIDRNFIHDLCCERPHGKIVGIYLDDGCYAVTVRRNVVRDMGGSTLVYPMCIKGRDHLVANNVMLDNEAAASIYLTEAGLSGLPDSPEGMQNEPVGGSRFFRNVMIQPGGQEVYRMRPRGPEMVGASDHNVVWYPGGKVQVFWANQLRCWAEWQAAGADGFDLQSIQAEPGFVDAAAGDFHLRPGGAAEAVGFVGFDLHDVGPLRPVAGVTYQP